MVTFGTYVILFHLLINIIEIVRNGIVQLGKKYVDASQIVIIIEHQSQTIVDMWQGISVVFFALLFTLFVNARALGSVQKKTDPYKKTRLGMREIKMREVCRKDFKKILLSLLSFSLSFHYTDAVKRMNLNSVEQ